MIEGELQGRFWLTFRESEEMTVEYEPSAAEEAWFREYLDTLDQQVKASLQEKQRALCEALDNYERALAEREKKSQAGEPCSPWTW